MTGLDIFLILVGVTALTDKLMRLICYLDRPRSGRRRYDERRDIA